MAPPPTLSRMRRNLAALQAGRGCHAPIFVSTAKASNMRMFCLSLALTASAFAQSESVQQLLDGAVKRGVSIVRLPAGRVPVAGRLTLNGADGLTIDGAGTTLVFSDHSSVGWSFNGCRGLTLRGFTIDYDPLPFIQGRITERSEDGKRYDFAVSAGYPELKEADQRYYRQAYIFEPDRPRWKPWVPDIYARRVEIIDERHGRFVMGYSPARHDLIAVGDRIVLTIRSGGAMRMNGCENVRIEDVTFLAAPGAAYLGRYMRGDNYYRYTIKPGPTPVGATEPRLMSSCADGLNIAFATKGPTIEGCRFSFMGDDSVNLHGVTFAVVGSESPIDVLVAWPYSAEQLASVIPKGGTARRLRPGNYEVLSTAVISGFTPLKTCTDEQRAAIHQVWPRGQKGRGTVFRLSLEEPLDAQVGEFIDVPDNNAPGFVIRDCVFEDHRARGLRLMAARGLIENNTFRRLKMNAITIGAEYGFWREAGWAEDIVIRGNTIEDVCRDAGLQNGRAYVLGAISVFGRNDPKSGLPVWPGNRNITIQGNTIRGCPLAGIFLAAARNVSVLDNRLMNVLFEIPSDGGREMGLDLRDAIDVRHAQDVTLSGNAVSHVGQAPVPED